jgi:hypothetical protein
MGSEMALHDDLPRRDFEARGEPRTMYVCLRSRTTLTGPFGELVLVHGICTSKVEFEAEL